MQLPIYTPQTLLRIIQNRELNMAGKTDNLKLKAVLVNDQSDSDGEQDRGEIVGISLEKLNLGPAKKLLVLNLGGELCDRVFYKDKASIPRGRKADDISGNFRIYKRPYSEEFLKFCFQRFEVGIWSSAMRYNIHGALACVIGELKSKLLFIWDQNDCTDSGFKTLDKRAKPFFLKELKKLWESPLCRGKYSPSNTLMIDDKPHKALMNPPHTAIFPVTYKASHATDTALGPKGDLRLYLDGVVEADDVPSYVKEHPFGQSAITTAHPDWDYYSKIVNHLGKKSKMTTAAKLMINDD